MPGQKNSGSKGRKRETGVATRHNRLVTDLMDDLRSEKKVDGVHIGRVTRKFGNGRVGVFYVSMEKEKTFNEEGEEVEKEVPRAQEAQAIIKGSFRGRGKHSVWIEQGGIVIMSDTGVGIMEIAGILTQEQLNTIAKTSFVDERILKPMATAGSSKADDDIQFAEDSESEDLSDGDIDDI